MITGEDADHDSVRTAVGQMLDNAAADLIANNQATQETLDDDEVRRNAIENLLREGATSTTREMRRRVRPARVPAVPMATLRLR
jgi:hypothetical protein